MFTDIDGNAGTAYFQNTGGCFVKDCAPAYPADPTQQNNYGYDEWIPMCVSFADANTYTVQVNGVDYTGNATGNVPPTTSCWV
jgi:hypothetical protein